MILFGFLVFFVGTMLSVIFSNFGILIITLLSLLLFLFCTKGIHGRFWGYAIVAFLIGISVVVLQYHWYISDYGVPYYAGGSDEYNFETYSLRQVVSNGEFLPWQISDDYISAGNNSKGFILVLAWMELLCSRFGGYHTMMPRILNLFLLLSTGALAYKYMIHNKMCEQKPKMYLRTFLAISLFPNCLYISAHVFRDTLSMFLTFAVVYIWDRVAVRRNPLSDNGGKGEILESYPKRFLRTFLAVPLSALLIYFGYTVRSETLFINLFAILITLCFSYADTFRKNIKYVVLVVAVLVSVLAFTQVGTVLNEKIINYTEYRQGMAADGLSASIFGMPLLPFGFFARLLYAAVFPLPIGVLYVTRMFGDYYYFANFFISCGTVWQIINYSNVVRGVRKQWDKTAIILIMMFSIVAMTTFTFRHFILVYPYLFILSSRGLATVSKQKYYSDAFFISFLLAVLAVVYFIIK